MLNQNQQDAVLAEGDLLVSAPPGSGKTTVIVNRGERLLKTGPGNIIAISFTKDAASQLKDRFSKKIDNQLSRRVLSCTFHRLCILQEQQAKIERVRKLIGEHERSKLIKSLLAKRKSLDYEAAVTGIDYFKSMVTPSLGHDDISLLFMDYQSALDKMQLMDFSDLLLNGVRDIKEGIVKPLPAKWMLVDEFQDIDEVQYELIMLYRQHGTEITGVGDDDQSLYSFRHALGFAGMMRFLQDTQAKMITLTTNYRSGPLIIEKAVNLIKHNESRVPKEMQSGNPIECNIELAFYDKLEEADEVCKTIMTTGSSFENFAVLARNNRQLDPIETALKSKQIPYSRTGEKFMDLPEPQAVVSLLRSLSDDSSIGLHHTLTWMGVSDVLLESFTNDHHCELNSFYAHLPKDNPNKKPIKDFLEIYSQWLSLLEEGGKEDLVVKGVASFFKRFCDEKKHKMFDSASTVLTRYKGSIKQRLGQLMQDNSEKSSGVSLMTMHSSKGLEFDNVCIVSANDAILPGDATVDAVIQEERRIFYVGLTRAKTNLFISCTEKPTRFIAEAGIF
jgi:superfamily I DNA/RNA helicase